jgi:hypothetical protein
VTARSNGQGPAASARLRSALVTVRREAKRWGYVDRDPSLAATTLLAGSGRSGTTWVEEVIDRHHDHRVLFEPLRASEEPSIAGMPHGLYLRPDDPAPRWRQPVEDILRGRVRNRWTDHQNHVVVARRRLVKEIRANPLLPWLATRFPDVRLVWLVRHPLAVAASARSLGWDTHLDELLGQPDLVADHLEPLLPVLEAVDGPVERFVAQWCVENLVPFRMLAPDQVHLVFYEELVDRPVEVAADLLRAIGQVPDDAVRAAVERPSKLARAESAVVRGGDLLSGWQRSLSADEISASVDLVAAMGLGDVYGPDLRPDADAGRALLAAPWPAAGSR